MIGSADDDPLRLRRSLTGRVSLGIALLHEPCVYSRCAIQDSRITHTLRNTASLLQDRHSHSSTLDNITNVLMIKVNTGKLGQDFKQINLTDMVCTSASTKGSVRTPLIHALPLELAAVVEA